MDEATAADAKVDGAEQRANSSDEASKNEIGALAEDAADRVFCCQDCGEAFREEAAYLEHRLHHLQESVSLDSQLDGLNDGKKEREAALFCTSCSCSFVEPGDFHSHMEKNHGQTSQMERLGSDIQTNSGITKQHTYECPECGKCYGVLGHFLNHQRSHRLAFKSVFHDLEHLKKKSFQCESCGRNYSRASALDAHRRCHEEKLVKSRTRGSGDAEESTVEVKQSIIPSEDAPEKPFKCSCGKAFTAMMRLKTHQRFSRNSQCTPEEMKEKPKKSSNEFYCSECKKTFSGHIALFNHQRWHTNHSDDSATKFPCEKCGKVFMTLTFYYRHQRMVHSDETPAKSFDHQVCQLQKKAFECKNCGLKFSRASALHSHQLHHTDAFRETEKDVQMPIMPLPNPETVESETKGTEMEILACHNILPTGMAEEYLDVNETDEDMESYEPGDFNVQIISASESEDEPVQDLHPDLELLCESDQEVRDDDDDTVLSPSNAVSKPEMDLKIVQVDFELADVQSTPIARGEENKTTEERFDCPECYRWFTSAASLRVHRMWHGVHKRRQQDQAGQVSLTCEDCGLNFAHMDVFKTHLHQHALEDDDEEEAEIRDNIKLITELDSESLDNGKNCDVHAGGDDAERCEESISSQTIPSLSTEDVGFDPLHKKSHGFYKCSICGKIYIYQVSFQKHLKLHESKSSTTDISDRVKKLHKYACPDCGMSFIRRTRLLSHLRVHRSRRALKPKPARCDQCNKDFTSIQAWIAHTELHNQNPFWCLSCVKGFPDEKELDKHLLSHTQKHHGCNICHKSFSVPSKLISHYKTHTGAKPFPCTLCGKNFSFAANLMSHRRKHFRVHVGSSNVPIGIKKSAIISKGRVIVKKRVTLSRVNEAPEIETNAEELSGKEEQKGQIEPQKTCDNTEFEDQSYSEESDCGEPAHLLKLSKPLVLDGTSPLDELKSGTGEPQLGQGLAESESKEVHMHREHKYWEWECWECDMGFDEVEKLHLHYIKHATGELPILQADSLD